MRTARLPTVPVFTARNSSHRKVMFSQVCVSHSVHWGGLVWCHFLSGPLFFPVEGYDVTSCLVPCSFRRERVWCQKGVCSQGGWYTPCYWHLQGGHGTGKTGNLVLTFSRQGKHREFFFDTGKNSETQGKYFSVTQGKYLDTGKIFDCDY